MNTDLLAVGYGKIDTFVDLNKLGKSSVVVSSLPPSVPLTLPLTLPPSYLPSYLPSYPSSYHPFCHPSLPLNITNTHMYTMHTQVSQ